MPALWGAASGVRCALKRMARACALISSLSFLSLPHIRYPELLYTFTTWAASHDGDSYMGWLTFCALMDASAVTDPSSKQCKQQDLDSIFKATNFEVGSAAEMRDRERERMRMCISKDSVLKVELENGQVLHRVCVVRAYAHILFAHLRSLGVAWVLMGVSMVKVKGSDADDDNPLEALNRGEWLELLVRVAKAKCVPILDA